MKHISFDIIFISLCLFFCVFLEHAFQLYGLLIIATVIFFQRNRMMFFAVLSLILGLISDMLFAVPLGVTTLVINLSLLLWIALGTLSRLRFFFFVVLILVSTFILSLFRLVHVNLFITLVLIGLSWLFARQIYAPKNSTGKISI